MAALRVAFLFYGISVKLQGKQVNYLVTNNDSH